MAMLSSKPLTMSDVFDVNPKTGALILGANRLDDYATKFLHEHCTEALEKPMALPVEKMIEEAGLKIKTASLSRDLDIFGCCLLLDGYVDIYDAEKGDYEPKFYPAGTLLFDPNSEWIYGEGCKRNTLIHEMLHWEKDKTYFQILNRKNRKAKEQLYPIMCRQSRSNYEPAGGKKTKRNEVQWLEWQAHKLTPRILMPRDMFILKAKELLQTIDSSNSLVQQLAEFFIVSRSSVKIRLIEVGLEEQIAQLSDFEEVFAELRKTKDYVSLSIEDAFQMLRENVILEEWVDSRGFVFVDGYFVLPSEKNIIYKDGQYHLTKSAKKNIGSCALNIREQHFLSYEYVREDLYNCAVLYKTESSVDQRIITFSPRMQSQLQEGIDTKDVKKAYMAARDNLVPYDESVEKELLRRIGDEDCTLSNCLWFLIENRGWRTGLDFYDHTLVHENYHGWIRDNKQKANKMKTDTLMAICVGLGLRLRLTEKIYGKSENRLHYYEEPDKTRIRIMETFPGLDIVNFNRLLEASNLEPLGSKDRHAG